MSVGGPDSREYFTPTIERDVRGSNGEAGFLFRAPHRDDLLWDLEAEVASARREWRPRKEGWWIAASYYRTVLALALRAFPSVQIFGEAEDRLISRDGSSVLQERLL